MKKMTLDETWKLCMAQWSWLIKQLQQTNTLSVESLKVEWLKKHKHKEVWNNCFFCEYSFASHNREYGAWCRRCPARKIVGWIKQKEIS